MQHKIQTEKPINYKEQMHAYSTISTHKVNNTTTFQEKGTKVNIRQQMLLKVSTNLN